MSDHPVTPYRRYQIFRTELDQLADAQSAFELFAECTRDFGITATAIVESGSTKNQAGQEGQRSALISRAGPALFWSGYIALCRERREPLLRVSRLTPRPIALSDIRKDGRLAQRCAPLKRLLHVFRLDDVFAIPIFAPEHPGLVVMTAGRNLALNPSNRYLLVQMAHDLVLLGHQPVQHCASKRAASKLKALTKRERQVAKWVIAGKSDWETGRILDISHKTVNFHVENIKRKYGVSSRSQFVIEIIKEGGIDAE